MISTWNVRLHEHFFVAYFGNGWKNFFESAAIELRLLPGVFHIDDVKELQCVNGRVTNINTNQHQKLSY